MTKLSIKQRIILIIGVLLLGASIFGVIRLQVKRAANRIELADTLSEKDFIEKEFKIKEIWLSTYTKENMPQAKSKYIFISVENHPYNLRFGLVDYGESTTNINSLMDKLSDVEDIIVKLNIKDLELVSEAGVIEKLRQFILGLNREVEIYKLSTKDGIVLFEQDIHTIPSTNNIHVDIAVDNLIIFSAIVFAILYILVVGLPKLKNKKRTAKQTNCGHNQIK